MEHPTTLPTDGPANTCGLATASMVCGICSVILGPFSGIAAIVTGHMALGRIKRSGDVLQGRGAAMAGLILGYLFTILSLIIIPIMVVVSFSAGNAAITKARSLTALATVTAVKSAVDGFMSEYGKLPDNGSSDVTLVSDKDIALLATLLGQDAGTNPKSIKFLSVREGRLNKNGLIYKGPKVVGLYDPWGGSYKIRLDLDYDETLDVGGTIVRGHRVAVWSDGADQKAGTPDDVRTW